MPFRPDPLSCAAGQLARAFLASETANLSDQELIYQYNANGNRTAVLINGAPTLFVANELNQYANVGDTTLNYDADGNLTSRTNAFGTSVFDFDAENRLVHAATPEGNSDYEHDAFGSLLAVTDNGEKHEFVTDPFGAVSVVAEYDEDGNVVARYNHGVGLTQFVDADGTQWYFGVDGVGNIANIGDALGRETASFIYDPFGRLLAATGENVTPFGFGGNRGGVTQAHGLIYMASRFYDPDNGGQFLPWLRDTTLTEKTFEGLPGHTYAFYTRARDNVGNVEPPPPSPDTSFSTALPGDANFDGSVDGTDLNIWMNHRFVSDTVWTTGDFNADGVTDGSDFNIWADNRFTVAEIARDSTEIVNLRPPKAALKVVAVSPLPNVERGQTDAATIIPSYKTGTSFHVLRREFSFSKRPACGVEVETARPTIKIGAAGSDRYFTTVFTSRFESNAIIRTVSSVKAQDIDALFALISEDKQEFFDGCFGDLHQQS